MSNNMKLTKLESLKNINAQKAILQPNPWVILFALLLLTMVG